LDNKDRIRRKAEEVYTDNANDNHMQDNPNDLIHELRVHQIELDMQNEELREVQIELEDSRRKYFELYNLAPVGYLTLDKNGIILEVNLAGASILGVEKSKLINSAFINYVESGSRHILHHNLKKALDNGEKQKFEIKLLNDDKSIVLNETIAINDVNGNLKEFRTVLTDITEQKITQDALIESQLRLSELIDFLPDATMAINVKGEIIAWNKAIVDMTGFTSEDMLGKKNYEYSLPFYGVRKPILIDLVLKCDKKVFEKKYQFINRENNAFIAETEVNLNGNLHVLWVKAVPLYDQNDDINGAIESIRDITEFKKYQVALKKSEERFRAVAESAADAIVTTDSDGNIIFFNDSLIKIFGYSRNELNGKSLTLFMPKRFKQKYLKELQSFKKSGKHKLIGKTVNTIGLKKDKTEFPFEMSLSAWQSEGRTYFTSILRDLTERKEAEKQIKKSLEEKEILLREVHHRVKNNMQIISSLLNLQTKNVDNNKIVNLLKESQNRVKTMAIIHEKLYQSKDFTKIDVADYIQSLVSAIFFSYAVKGSQITSILDIDDIKFNMETAVPCGLIISEIVSNSLKYAFPDGINGKLKVSMKKYGDKFELIVCDNGIGLPKDLDFKNTESLGLQLVNSLVDQIDGEIKLNKSHGTEFKIIFKEIEYKKRL
jgi:PAS domain S-box-containing protein